MTTETELLVSSQANTTRSQAADHGAVPRSHWGQFRQGFLDMARVCAPTFVLGVIAVTIVASAVGLVLTNVIEDSSIVAFDIDLANTLEASRTPRLTTLTGIGTFFADPLPVAGFWFLAVVVSAVALRSWRPPMLFMIAIGGEKLSYLLTTLVVDRPRPEVETVGKVHVTSAYPSGHVGSAVSLWMALALLIMVLLSGRLDRRAVVVSSIVGLFFAVEVGYSRLYRGHHFFTDVVAGALIGAVWVVIAYKFILAPYLRQRREERHHAPPPASVPANAQVAS
jgi:undecaprenyl-diphosphatase